jgi:hypothetical protein
MDNAVALVQAYLRLNGYFTVTEFPIIEALAHGGHRMATDIDVLGVRFAGAARAVPLGGAHGRSDRVLSGPDPALGIGADDSDLLIGEVKVGRAELNHGARDPDVLRTALTRFGCCTPNDAERVVPDLIRNGHGYTARGHRVRLVAFGAYVEEPLHGFLAITLGHVIETISRYMKDNWDVLRVSEFKDPALGMLAMMIKSHATIRVEPRSDIDRP